MKLVDMKQPKPKKMDDSPTVGYPSDSYDKYPYGLQIRLEKEQIDKIPGLKNMKVGDKVMVHGAGKVTQVRMEERQEGKDSHTVEIQIEKVDVTGNKPKDKMNNSEYRDARKG